MDRGIVEVECPACGPVTARTTELVCGISETDEAALCQLDCPTCGRSLLRPVPLTDIATLLLLGARRAEQGLPYELLETHTGPAVTWDEVLEFHVALADHCCPQEELVRRGAA